MEKRMGWSGSCERFFKLLQGLGSVLEKWFRDGSGGFWRVVSFARFRAVREGGARSGRKLGVQTGNGSWKRK